MHSNLVCHAPSESCDDFGSGGNGRAIGDKARQDAVSTGSIAYFKSHIFSKELSETNSKMLPSLINLSQRKSAATVNFEDGNESNGSAEKAGSKRRLQQLLLERFSEVVNMWKLKLSEYFGNDFLADGIAYSCASNIQECYSEDHYTWDTFYTLYGDVCVMVSTRALQNLGFTMNHGDKLESLNNGFHGFFDTDVNKTWNWQPDWIITEWIKGLETTNTIRDKDQQWKQPTEEESRLLEKFKNYTWPITGALPRQPDEEDEPERFTEWKSKKEDLEKRWLSVTADNKSKYIKLLQAAFRAAPWWLYKNEITRDAFNSGLINEFTVSPTNRPDLIRQCILAKRIKDRIVYVLDPSIEPGTEEAGRYYETAMNLRRRTA